MPQAAAPGPEPACRHRETLARICRAPGPGRREAGPRFHAGVRYSGLRQRRPGNRAKSLSLEIDVGRARPNQVDREAVPVPHLETCARRPDQVDREAGSCSIPELTPKARWLAIVSENRTTRTPGTLSRGSFCEDLNHDCLPAVVQTRTCPAAIRTRTDLHRYIVGAAGAPKRTPLGLVRL